MIELTPYLKKLLSLPGLSAYEAPVRSVIAEAWQPLVDELSVSPLGSLHGLKRGTAPEPRPRILLAAHMDAIGLMATKVIDGFIRITEVGGIDPRILAGTLVTVHGRRDLPGVVVQPPERLLPASVSGQAVPMKYLFVDTGLSAQETAALVRPGDLVSFAQVPMELAGGALAGHTLDNRASVAAVTLCLEELQHASHAWDVVAAATVQEEETLGGGFTSPVTIRPDLAVAIDVTFAKGPGSSDYRTYPLNGGPTIAWGSDIHPALFKAFKELAERLDMPYHTEVTARHSGTDAYAMQIVGEGIPSVVIGIPLRYMHTPVEEVCLKDIERTGRLLAQFITGLAPDFVSKIVWED